MNKNDMTKVLRDLADSLESVDIGQHWPVEVTVFEHYEQVKGPETGDAIVDARWHGRSIVIHVGDERWANHTTLAKRLPAP